MSVDLVEAYPAEAGIKSWRRMFRMERGQRTAIEITDSFRLAEPAAAVFYSLMTPCPPSVMEEGLIRLELPDGQYAWLSYDSRGLTVEIQPIVSMESRLIRNWGTRMYRIVLTEKTAAASGSTKVRIIKA